MSESPLYRKLMREHLLLQRKHLIICEKVAHAMRTKKESVSNNKNSFRNLEKSSPSSPINGVHFIGNPLKEVDLLRLRLEEVQEENELFEFRLLELEKMVEETEEQWQQQPQMLTIKVQSDQDQNLHQKEEEEPGNYLSTKVSSCFLPLSLSFSFVSQSPYHQSSTSYFLKGESISSNKPGGVSYFDWI